MDFFDERYPKVDKKLMDDGVDIDFGNGFFVGIRHISSKKVDQVRAQKLQQMKIGLRNAKLNPEQSEEVTLYVLAYGIVTGWHGGDSPKFTHELALKVLTERPEFREDVITASTTYEAFRDELVEDASGNSSASSNGVSSGETGSKRSRTTS